MCQFSDIIFLIANSFPNYTNKKKKNFSHHTKNKKNKKIDVVFTLILYKLTWHIFNDFILNNWNKKWLKTHYVPIKKKKNFEFFM